MVLEGYSQTWHLMRGSADLEPVGLESPPLPSYETMTGLYPGRDEPVNADAEEEENPLR